MKSAAKLVLKSVTRLTAFGALAITGTYLVRVRSFRQIPLAWVKVLGESLAGFVALAGVVSGVLAGLLRMPFTGVAAGLAAFLSGRYIRRATLSHSHFEQLFGPAWQEKIPPEMAQRLPRARWGWRLRSPVDEGSRSRRAKSLPQPRFQRNVEFWTIRREGEPDRPLLCDIWEPPSGIEPSGVAFIYLHGSAWHFLDKDYHTRPMFSHLAGQGHVIMDVAYRMCPEVGLADMVGDAKRAVAWMKSHAAEYGVDPEKVVLAGASAGGHLALLAAYAPYHPELTPQELMDESLAPAAVVSWYGPTDLLATNEHAGAVVEEFMDKLDRRLAKDSAAGKAPSSMFSRPDINFYPITLRQMMLNFLGGQPDEVPHMYELASPINFVGPDCPPTLLFQGEHDMLVSAQSVHGMYEKLVKAGVPAIYVEFPQTDHAFDLFMPYFSPTAEAALYDVDRLLALIAAEEKQFPLVSSEGLVVSA